MGEKNYVVYKHYDANKECRYVGVATLDTARHISRQRPYDFTKRHHGKQWGEVFATTRPEVEIVAEFSSREEAVQREHDEIISERSKGSRLTNVLAGDHVISVAFDDHARHVLGSGRRGKPGYWTGKKRDPETMRKLQAAGHTPEAIAKRAAKMRGKKLTPEQCRAISERNKGVMLGFKHSEETRKKMRESHLGKPIGPMSEAAKEKKRLAAIGRKLSEEAKRKIGDAHRGWKSPRAKEVFCVELGKTFRCAMDASKETSANVKHIQACCAGRRKKSGGYTWQYVAKEAGR
jgi:hypothetical protein